MSLCWKFKNSLTSDRLADLLAPYCLDIADAQMVEWTVLDDPSWSLWQNHYLWLSAHHNQTLQIWQESDPLYAEPLHESQSYFPHQLKSEKWARTFKALLGVRAATAKFRGSWHETKAVVRNNDDKIVTRLCLFTLPDMTLLQLNPLRGYRNETEAITRKLSSLKPTPSATLTMRQRLLYSGLDVTIPESRLTFGLTADDATHDAVIKMTHRLIHLAQQQEQGICRDIDTEYVHQYRVALRKARSLVSLFKNSLGPTESLRAQLKQLAQQTNTLRDLDVFSPRWQRLPSLLPETLRPGLQKTLKRIQRRRNAQQKQIASVLRSADYTKAIQHLLATLDQLLDPPSPSAGKGIKTSVSKKISRQYERIRREGHAITVDTADEAIHELRIECKKFRYLLELFGELFDQQQLKFLTKKLKQLQDILGRFNDLAVQQDFLNRIGETTHDNTQKISLNALVAVLYQQQRHERTQVENAIADFTCQEIKTHIYHLIKDNEGS